ncbi:signal peptide peptidase SppA [bacterium]|nr:signal peptide peptidase SppA [bacterium]
MPIARRLLLTSAVLAFAAMTILSTGCFNTSNVNVLPMPDDKLTARVVKTVGAGGDNRVLLLDIDGVITAEGEQVWFWDREATTSQIEKKLRKAAKDDRIKAVVLRINSPGGGVTASDVVYREIRRYKEAQKIPVVTMMMDVGASGGYYIACASDEIIAHPTTITGSVGVIIYSLGFDGLFGKIGMESRVIKSGALKDMGNPFDEFSEEERAVFQAAVDGMYARFFNVVLENRKMDPEKLRELADGRIYTGEQAAQVGLIDRTGYIDDAIRSAMDRAKIGDAKVILYTDSYRKETNVYSNSFVKTPSLGMPAPDLEMMLELSRPRAMYMWLGQ